MWHWLCHSLGGKDANSRQRLQSAYHRPDTILMFIFSSLSLFNVCNTKTLSCTYLNWGTKNPSKLLQVCLKVSGRASVQTPGGTLAPTVEGSVIASHAGNLKSGQSAKDKPLFHLTVFPTNTTPWHVFFLQVFLPQPDPKLRSFRRSRIIKRRGAG